MKHARPTQISQFSVLNIRGVTWAQEYIQIPMQTGRGLMFIQRPQHRGRKHINLATVVQPVSTFT